MKFAKVVLMLVFGFAQSSIAATHHIPLPELPLRAIYSTSEEPLTTEKVWALDSGEPNPHRQRWVLSRKVTLDDLQAHPIPGAAEGAGFGVGAASIRSETVSFVRPDGPWYRPYTDFPCLKDPVSWFATITGAHLAADAAAHSWEQSLEADKIRLAILLGRIRAATPVLAMKAAHTLFDDWLKQLEDLWRSKGRVQAKLEEWQSYEKRAAELNVCAQSSEKSRSAEKDAPVYADEYIAPSKRSAIPWEVMMEAPATGEVGLAGTKNEMKLLARAPARRWDGLFSIRATVEVSGRKLNGRFLIDSGVGQSVLSPSWLAGQGILPIWVERPGVPPKRVPWGGGSSEAGGGLAPQAIVDRVEISNYDLHMNDFLLFDTEFFAPPETANSCCDGVLGTDFLRHYVVELQPGPPAEVKLWPPESFHLPEGTGAQWVEAALGPTGEPISSCIAQLAGSPLKLVGVRWDTGREGALDVHLPWQKDARSAIGGKKPNAWQLSCGAATAGPIASEIPAFFPKLEPFDNTAILNKVPAVSVGMALLGRERVYLDFPHGRIWFPEKTLTTSIRENRSGLVVKYEFIKGKGDDRGLFVKAIKNGSPAQELAKRGLHPGMMITRIDSKDSDSLDAWEVEQRLSGAYSETVTVQWKTKKGLKMGALRAK